MIAIIPARGGSKGLPGKNIKSLNGKPLIAYTIEAALKSKSIDQVIVTTDSKEIATIASDYGASVPFLRPDELASDTASAVDVYLHAVEFVMKESGAQIEKFVVLLPTAPMRTEKHIDEAMELFTTSRASTLISVKEAETPISWYFDMEGDKRILNAGFGNIANSVANRQLNTQYYVPNGAIYVLDYNLLKEKRTYYCDNTIGYLMSVRDSVDIDTIDEFEYAEYLMRKTFGKE